MNKLYCVGCLLLAATSLMGQEVVRFDETVRQYFFAGLTGDKAAMEKGMAITTKVLAAEPNHAEAMVWHGTGVFFASIAAFQAKDFNQGMKLYGEGVAMMDKAVALEPKSIGVRIPRGATYLAASRYMPKEMGAALLAKGLVDYEICWQMQKGHVAQMSHHSLGELLVGLSEGYLRTGNLEKSQEYAELVKKYLPDSPAYLAKVEKVLAKKEFTGADANCMGCHYGSPKVKTQTAAAR